MRAEGRRSARLLAALALTGTALAGWLAAGCGETRGTARTLEGRRGGHLTVLAPGGIDSLDPAAARTPLELAVAYATQRPLYSYPARDSRRPFPDLAADPPALAPDGRTVTVRLRTHVRYGPPVGRAVTAGDAKYAIERAIAQAGAGSSVQAYF